MLVEGRGAAALSPQGKLLLPLLSKFVGTLQGLMKDQAKLVIASNGSGCWDLGHRMYLELTSASCPQQEEAEFCRHKPWLFEEHASL
jgi:hypothetical protein